MIPEGFVGGGRNACVEMGAGDGPSVGGPDGICQELRVIIGVGVTESLLGGVEGILTVKEDESPFGFGSVGNFLLLQKRTPPEARRLVQRGTNR